MRLNTQTAMILQTLPAPFRPADRDGLLPGVVAPHVLEDPRADTSLQDVLLHEAQRPGLRDPPSRGGPPRVGVPFRDELIPGVADPRDVVNPRADTSAADVFIHAAQHPGLVGPSVDFDAPVDELPRVDGPPRGIHRGEFHPDVVVPLVVDDPRADLSPTDAPLCDAHHLGLVDLPNVVDGSLDGLLCVDGPAVDDPHVVDDPRAGTSPVDMLFRRAHDPDRFDPPDALAGPLRPAVLLRDEILAGELDCR